MRGRCVQILSFMALRILKNLIFLPLRMLVFAIGFFAYWMETAADLFVGATGSSEYARQGSCNRCGRCCYFLGLEMPQFMVGRTWLIRTMNAWHDAALNFEPAGVNKNLLVYRCRYYRPGTGGGGCSIYPFRHRLCRFFPKQTLYGKPDLNGECGFFFIRREVVRRLKDQRQKGALVFGDILKEKKDKMPL
jgi:Fe-S-cluster containining protein